MYIVQTYIHVCMYVCYLYVYWQEEILELSEELPFPSQHAHTISNVHTGNIISCRYNNDGSLIATGSSGVCVCERKEKSGCV